MTDGDVQRAADHWGDDQRHAYYREGGLDWLSPQPVKARINNKISGAPDIDWVDYLADRYLRERVPLDQCLSLCCGEGAIERMLVSRGIVNHCLGVDAAEGSLQRARQHAADVNIPTISYQKADVNRLQLADNSHDLIVAHSALHHLSDLERVFNTVRGALRPQGLFVVHDYVGPDRLQFSDRTLQAADAALRILPERLRRSVSWDRHGRIGPGARRSPLDWLRLIGAKLRAGTFASSILRRLTIWRTTAHDTEYIKERVPRIGPDEVALIDPTEAARSSEIMPLLRANFEILEEVPLGGTLLRAVLDDIAGNFDPEDPVAIESLKMLFAAEDALIEEGQIGSDYYFVVAASAATASG